MDVGIDQLSFYTSNYKLELSELALTKGYNRDYYWQQLKQQAMGVSPPSEDWLTMAANAMERMLDNQHGGSAVINGPSNLAERRKIWQQQLKQVGLLLFATESSQEMSKASASYLHHWFALPSRCRIIELKQACYAGTAGLQLALDWLRQHPDQQAVLIASDIADYQIGSSAESSQGCGAVAMLLTHNPSMLTIEPTSAYCSKHSWDFWHPNNLPHALVDSRLSCEIYIKLLECCWQQIAQSSEGSWHDYQYFCYHSPVPKLVYLAHRRAAKTQGVQLSSAELAETLEPSLKYTQLIGNCYTASLYLNLLALWENAGNLTPGKRVMMYSYGSGSIGELLIGRFNSVPSSDHTKLVKVLENRRSLPLAQYQTWSAQRRNRETTSADWQLDNPDNWLGGSFRLRTIQQGKRGYRFKQEEL